MSEALEPSSKRARVDAGDKQWRGTKQRRQTPQYKFSSFVKVFPVVFLNILHV